MKSSARGSQSKTPSPIFVRWSNCILQPPAAAAIPEAALEEIGAILRHYSITPDTLKKELETQRALQSNGEIQAPANFRESLSPIGQVLYDISLGTPDNPARLLTTEEIHEEIARRRGYARTWMHDAEKDPDIR